MTTYYAGILSWMAFWVFDGQAFSSRTVASIALFAAAYPEVRVDPPLGEITPECESLRVRPATVG